MYAYNNIFTLEYADFCTLPIIKLIAVKIKINKINNRILKFNTLHL